MSKLDSYEDALQALRRAVEAARTARPAGDAPLGRPAVSDGGQIDPTAVAFNVFSRLLDSDGLRAALYSLLRRSDYRFVSIFRFKDGKATSVVHVDRENLAVTQAAEVPDTATYCSFVRETGQPFVTADASQDSRTASHPAKDVVLAYCGVPVLQPDDGQLIGTLCFYDLIPRDPQQLDLELLLQVSSAIAQSGKVPAYPRFLLTSS
ncbi:GAF domain-containing protein [Aquincola tertiaricarbonis]|uniref:GAF domain-containing protein n=1 Tax=Aquincola tertiaricarbonis TaxID=391953 RepID=UPI0006151B3E|nr:GAF domain-containing protein [Aquincola tertiaricarbonis]